MHWNYFRIALSRRYFTSIKHTRPINGYDILRDWNSVNLNQLVFVVALGMAESDYKDGVACYFTIPSHDMQDNVVSGRRQCIVIFYTAIARCLQFRNRWQNIVIVRSKLGIEFFLCLKCLHSDLIFIFAFCDITHGYHQNYDKYIKCIQLQNILKWINSKTNINM